MTILLPLLRGCADAPPAEAGEVGHADHIDAGAAEESADHGGHADDGGAQTNATQDAAATHAHGASTTSCESTWQAIRTSVFEAKGCTASVCHGSPGRAGQLDLAGGDAHASLVNRPAHASLAAPLNRVTPGEQALSFLYLKLAAATEGIELPAGGGSPMPVARSPLDARELEAIRLWIRAGAPEHGVVAGTQTLLPCTQPASADPNKAPRPPIPAVEEGFQHAAGPWAVPAQSESEVCFATYYDLTESAPEWARLPCTIGGRAQTCVGVNAQLLSQDAQSHHSAVGVYAGDVPVTDASWGAWRCAGGERAGASCSPLAGDGACGEGSVCQAVPRKMVTCTGFGPPGKEASTVGAGGAQSPVSQVVFPSGVYAKLPLRGVVLWNSHGFNLTDKDTTIEQYNTFWYARPEQRTHELVELATAGERTPNANVWIDVPPYQKREYCSLHTLPRYARLVGLTSHVHKRGVLFRAWLPPHAPSCPLGGCTPDETEPTLLSRLYNDAAVRYFDPPLALDAAEPEARTLKFCALYDNGADDPSLLKRKSQLPAGASCEGSLYCAGGERAGQVCTTDAECGAGSCDACGVTWGVTTEDEMLFLMGTYFVAPPIAPVH